MQNEIIYWKYPENSWFHIYFWNNEQILKHFNFIVKRLFYFFQVNSDVTALYITWYVIIILYYVY